MLQYNLDHGLDGFPIGDAWVLAGPTAGLGASALGSIDAAIGSLNEATGRSFPSDYRCVMNAAGIELWRPLDRPPGVPAARLSRRHARFRHPRRPRTTPAVAGRHADRERRGSPLGTARTASVVPVTVLGAMSRVAIR